MTAYLTLRAGSDLTISDIAAWLDRARTLGAEDTSPVRLGAPPTVRAADGPADQSGEPTADAPETVDEPTLTVQVSVRRTVLPPAATRARESATR